jgi:SNF2 family DNA or RNA helicase
VTIPEQHLEVIEFGDPDGESIDDCIVRIATSMIDPETGELPHASAIIHAALREGNAEKTGWIIDNFDADEPVVLLAEYHETLTLMRERLDADQIPYVYVDGGVVDGQRAHAVARFQAGEVPIFLAQIDAAGASIDLFRSHISIAIDHTQKANNYAQALGRTCRRGQVHECLHLDLVANCMQQLCVDRLRAADDFHTALSRVREVLDSLRP